MDTPEQPEDKLPSCSCYNPNRRPCQYEVLYDEALCQVESLQRQVRHLRTEMRRVEDENAVLIQQMNKHSSEPQPDISQLKIKHENEMKKREESWQRELQRWRKKFQIRDSEIMTLKARIAELEGESKKPTTCKAVQVEVRCATDTAENTLKGKNESSSTAKVSTKSSAVCAVATDKSYEDIMDELFGASPKPDIPESVDDGKNGELVKQSTESKGTKEKEQAKKLAIKSSPTDELQGVSVAYVKKDVDICSKDASKLTKHSTAKSGGGATVNKDIPKSSYAKTSVPCLDGQKTGSEANAKDVGRNVFDKMKMHSKECAKDNESSVGASSLCRSEKQTANQEREVCKDDKKKSTSTKEVVKLSPMSQKLKKPGSPKKITLLQDVRKSNKVQLEQQKIGSAGNLKTQKVAVDQNCKRKLLDSGVSVDTKEQNIQKRTKSSSADKAGSSKLKGFERLEHKIDGLASGDSLPSSDNIDKPINNKKGLPSGPARKDNKHSNSSVTKVAVENKPEMVKTSKLSDVHNAPRSKMDKKPVNLSDFERVKAYMNLANRIDCEKKQANQPEKVKSLSSTSRQNCVSPSLSSDFDDSRHVNETSQEYHPSSSCYSPSVLPVKEDEYDPFNPGIDVFPMSKYNIQKGRLTKKYPVLQQSVLRIGSKPEINKDDGKMMEISGLHEEYTPTSISRNNLEEKQVEPVEYIPSSTLYSDKKHAPRSSPLLGRAPSPTHLTLEVKATKVHPSAPTTAPNPDQLVMASKQSVLNESLQKKSLPVPSHSFVPIASNSTSESNRSEHNKTSDNVFKEASVTSKSGVALPQLNLSYIGDNLLSGVREALNMVKTLSPQMPGHGDEPASKCETQSSEEQQPPSLLSKKKDVPVLMPSPLKKPPKDNDKQVLHAKILSSIPLDEGNRGEDSDLKCVNPKVSQSVRLWRKRKRTTTAEPKGILKKSRSVACGGVEGEECSCDQDLLCNRQNCRISSSINAPSVRVAAVHEAAEKAGEENNNSRERDSLLGEAPTSLEVQKSKGILRSRSEGFHKNTQLSVRDTETVCNKLCETDISNLQQHDKGCTPVHVSSDMTGSKTDEQINMKTLTDHPERKGEKFGIESRKQLRCDDDEMQASTEKQSTGVHMAVAKRDGDTSVENMRNDLGNCQVSSRPPDSKTGSLPGFDGQKLLNDKTVNEQFDGSNSLTCELLQHPQQGNAIGKTSHERLSSSAEKDQIECQGTSGRVNPKVGEDDMSSCRTKHEEGKECDGCDYASVSMPKTLSTEAMDTSVTTLEFSGDNWLNDVSVSSSATSGSSHLAADETEYFEVEGSPRPVCNQAGEKSGMESRVLGYDSDVFDGKQSDATRKVKGIQSKMPGDINDGTNVKDRLCSISKNKERQSPAMPHGSEKSTNWQISRDSIKLTSSPNSGVKPNTSEVVRAEDAGRNKMKCLQAENGANDKSLSAPLIGSNDTGCEVSGTVGPVLGLGGSVDAVDSSSQLEKVAIKQEVCNADDDSGEVKRVQQVRGLCDTSPASVIVLSDDDSSSPTSSSGLSSASSCLSSEEESESGNRISQGEEVEQSSSGGDNEERSSSECQVSSPDDLSSDAQSGSECSTGSKRRTSESNVSSCCDDEKESGIEQMDSEPEEGMEEGQMGGQDDSSSCCELESSSSCSSCCNSNSGSCTGSDIESSRADGDQITEGTTSVLDTDESANQETCSSENKASGDKTSMGSDSSEHGSQSGDDVLMEVRTSHDEDVLDLFTEPENDFETGNIPDGKPTAGSMKSERRRMPLKFGDGIQDGMVSSATHCSTADNNQRRFKHASDGSRSALDATYSGKKTASNEIDRLATTEEPHGIHGGVSQRRSAGNERNQSNSKRPYNIDQRPRSGRNGTETERRPSRREVNNDRSNPRRTSTGRTPSLHSDTNRGQGTSQNSRVRR